MKYASNLVLFPVFVVLFSIETVALNQENSRQDLSKIVMRTGTLAPERVMKGSELEEYQRRQHKQNFNHVLGSIHKQSKKFEDPRIAKSRQQYAVMLLPKEFARPEIALLAEYLSFSHSDDILTRATKYQRLALLLRDLYHPDNLVSQRLGLLDLQPRISDLELTYLTAHAFELALENLAQISEGYKNVIDFHLSYAQVILWRLHYGKLSALHSLLDFEMKGGDIFLGTKAEKLRLLALEHVAMAERLLDDPTVELPTIYHPRLEVIAKSLTDEQKFEMILWHKDERDRKLEAESTNPFEELERARGLASSEKNPLDGFTHERYEQTRKFAKSRGFDEVQFVYTTMKNFALNRVKDKAVERYFPQEIMQRYLVSHGLVTRDMIAGIMRETANQIKRQAAFSELRGAVYHVD